jgi:hypothetical protein
MRPLAAFLTLAALAATPSAAGANVRISDDASPADPALVGDQVVWSSGGQTTFASPLGGPIRQLSIPTGGEPEAGDVRPLGTADGRFAFVRTDRELESHKGVLEPVTIGSQLHLAPLDGPYGEPLQRCSSEGLPVALSPELLAYLNCNSRRIEVRFLAGDRQPLSIAQPRGAFTRQLRTAGNWLAARRAFRDGRPEEIVVYDLQDGSEALHLTPTSTPTSYARSFDVNAAGRLLLAEFAGREDRLVWTPVDQPARNAIGDPVPASLAEPGFPSVRVAGESLAATRAAGCASNSGYDVVTGPLSGDLRSVTAPAERAGRAGVPAFDGRRLAWIDAGGVIARDLQAEPAATSLAELGCNPKPDRRVELRGTLRSKAPAALAADGRDVTLPFGCSFLSFVGPRSFCSGKLTVETQRRHRAPGKRKGVRRAVATGSVRLPPQGGDGEVTLNRLGRRMLRRSGRMPVRLRAVGEGVIDRFVLTRD